ncbi:AfsR/SARP family transcriptional regulator [Pseudonocardia sp. CA-107938]|uniref:AfsR/SARP family transcriptional regulator n=1 Tax=Pseudonocardia sp. CA-107938 TaxID=3240021 RepID=UPI003D8B9321
MGDLHVRLFGEIQITHRDRPLAFSSTKALELLCFLLVHADRPHTRETLADALWPDTTRAVARRYLRQTLWRLGTVLSSCATSPAEKFVISDPRWIQLDTPSRWWVDVHVVDAVYRSTRDVAAGDLDAGQIRDLDRAVNLHRGDLMAAWYHDWCVDQREGRRQILVALLEKLAAFCEAHRLHARGIDHVRAVLQHDPAREPAHRQLMRLYAAIGDRGAALRQFETCARLLDEEFNVAPSPATTALRDRIRAGRTVRDAARPTEDGDSLVAEIDARLGMLQASVDALHDLVARNLRRPAEPAGRHVPRTRHPALRRPE